MPRANFKTLVDARYLGEWFDPRDGSRKLLAEPLTAAAEGLALPQRPDARDWLLILRLSRM